MTGANGAKKRKLTPYDDKAQVVLVTCLPWADYTHIVLTQHCKLHRTGSVCGLPALVDYTHIVLTQNCNLHRTVARQLLQSFRTQQKQGLQHNLQLSPMAMAATSSIAFMRTHPLTLKMPECIQSGACLSLWQYLAP